MASLFEQAINQTYEGLIKTIDNEAISAGLKRLTDGAGNLLPIQISSTDFYVLSDGIQITDTASSTGFAINANQMYFAGNIDFTSATVTGLVVPPGPAGSSGTSGTSGTSGVNGTSGTSGSSGLSGSSGTSGSSGVSGTSGSSGTSGINGNDGTSGTSGVNGNDGTSGTSGVNGADGSSGTSGTSGVNGLPGNDGTSGTSGVNGNDGTSGTSGVNGADGSSGTSGVNGLPGNDGTSGTSGVNGNDGTSGTSGVNGVDGSSGTSGTSGVSGADGSSGTSGTSGVNGADGSSGTSGVNGLPGNDGTSGTSGVDGWSAGYLYQYDSNNTDVNPGIKQFSVVRTGDLSTATQFNISNIEYGGYDLSNVIETWDDSDATPKAYLTIRSTDPAVPNEFVQFAITGIVQTNVYKYFTVQFVDGATSLTNSQLYSINVSIVGNVGPTGSSGTSGITPNVEEGKYGAFYDLTIQPINAINTPQIVKVADTSSANGITLAADRFVIDTPGTYKLSATFQVLNSNNDTSDVNFWLNFNGTPYPNSAHYATLPPRKSSGNPSETLIHFSFVGKSINPGDYVELWWASETLTTTLYTDPATGGIPDSAAVNVSIVQVSAIEASTSGTSGVSGTSGTSGVSGTSGTSGVSGTSGTSGVNGLNGTAPLETVNAPMDLDLFGYDSDSYMALSRTITTGASFTPVIDFNDSKMLLTPWYLQDGTTLNNIILPFTNITRDTRFSYRLYQADPKTKRPTDAVWYLGNFILDPANGANQFFKIFGPSGTSAPVPALDTPGMLWLALQHVDITDVGGAFPAVISRANVVTNFVTTFNSFQYGGGINVLFHDPGSFVMPGSLAGVQFGHRDEGYVFGYRFS